MGSLDNKRGSAVFYESFYDSTKDLDDKTFREAWTAIMKYAFYDEEPEGISPISAMFFKMAKPNIDKAIQLRENGKGGGRPKKPLVLDEKPKKSLVSDKKPMVSGAKTKHIYDVDVDVDKDVDIDADVDVDVDVSGSDTHNTESVSTTTNKPSPVEIAVESQTEGYGLDSGSLKAFYEYNDERDWKMDWKTALKKWAAREHPPEQKQARNKFNNFERNHDNDELAKKIIQMQLGGN